MINIKRVTLFAGHYGSGKTNVAVNFALHLRESGEEVVIADLDIVNPYFRTKDSEEALSKAGIEIIASEYAGSNVDFPALPQSMYSLIDRKEKYAILDVGGDDRGAYALGRYAEGILEENNYDMLFVVNMYRPLTKTPELAIGIMREIEQAGGIKFTGIVNNSNLGEITTPKDIVNSYLYVDKVSELSGLPVMFTSIEESVASKMTTEQKPGNLFTIHLQQKVYNSFEEV